jgi:hypothetical protein
MTKLAIPGSLDARGPATFRTSTSVARPISPTCSVPVYPVPVKRYHGLIRNRQIVGISFGKNLWLVIGCAAGECKGTHYREIFIQKASCPY